MTSLTNLPKTVNLVTPKWQQAAEKTIRQVSNPNPAFKNAAVTGLGSGAAILGSGLLYVLAEHFRAGDVVKNIHLSPEQFDVLKTLVPKSADTIKDMTTTIYQNMHPGLANWIHAMRGVVAVPTTALIFKHLDQGINLLKSKKMF
jgi:hypothetical protein